MLWFIGFILMAIAIGIVGMIKTNDRRIADRGPDPLRPIERRVNSMTAMGCAQHPDEF